MEGLFDQVFQGMGQREAGQPEVGNEVAKEGCADWVDCWVRRSVVA